MTGASRKSALSPQGATSHPVCGSDGGKSSAKYVPPHKKKTVEPTKVHPPLLALIDVLFTLMMFFIVAAKQKVMEGEIPASLPGNPPPGVADINPVRIEIAPSGQNREFATYSINGRQIAADRTEDLYSALKSRQAVFGPQAAKTVPVVIKSRQDVRWEWVVNAYNQALRAQFEKIGFEAI